MYDVNRMFESVNLSREDMMKVESVRHKFTELANLINEIAGDSREKSLAFTKLEEASMWVNKAIVREVRLPKHHD